MLMFDMKGGMVHQTDLIDGMLADSAASGDVASISSLLAAGADVNSTRKVGETPLFWAAGGGHLAAIDALINAGASVDRESLAQIAVLSGRPEALRSLLLAGATRPELDFVIAEVNKDKTAPGLPACISVLAEMGVFPAEKLRARLRRCKHAPARVALVMLEARILSKSAEAVAAYVPETRHV